MSTDKLQFRVSALFAGMLFLALVARLYGINHGLPYGYQVDEKWIVNSAMSFGTGDLNPHLFHWPGTTIMYLLFFEFGVFFVGGWFLGIFDSAEQFALFFMEDPSLFYLIARTTIAIIGTATVYLTYELGKRMFSAKVGIIAAAFVAFNYLAIGVDHIVFPDTPLVFLSVLAMIFIYNIMTQGTTSAYWLAGFITGCGIATKYNAGVLILPLSLAHCMRVENGLKKFRSAFLDKKYLGSLVMVLLGFLISCPFALLDFSNFYNGFISQLFRTTTGSFGTDIHNPWFYYFRNAFPSSIGVGLTILGIVAFFYSLKRFKREDILLLAFICFYFVYLFKAKVGAEKYLLFVIPFWCILCARLLHDIIMWMDLTDIVRNALLFLCTIMLIIGPFSRGLYNDYLLTQKDTRTLAKEWIESNIPFGLKIAIDSGNFDIAKYNAPINASIDSLRKKYEELQDHTPAMWVSSAKKFGKYLQLKMQAQKEKGYEIIRIVPSNHGVIDEKINLNEFSKMKVQYVVISSFVYKIYKDPWYQELHPKVANFYNDFYSSLDRHCDLIKTFDPLTETGPGPTIKVYKGPYN
jgi:hypothetical protein